MVKTKAVKIRNKKRNNKKRKLGLKPKKRAQQQHPGNNTIDDDPVLFGDAGVTAAALGGGERISDDDDSSAGTPTSDRVQRLLEPYTKDQLIAFLSDAAASDSALLDRVRAAADGSVAHRKLFVHGLGWDSTRETLMEAFSSFGPIEDCNVVADKASGRAKGYGFVLFKTRAATVRALKQPQKHIKNRLAHCQLASVGPTAPASSTAASASGSTSADTIGRKIHVSNVHTDAAPDKLKAFFARFGEIEAGPIGFDMLTGKSRGFAFFVYKTQEGARRALEEPYKMFEGHQLHCQLATDGAQKGKAAASVPGAASLNAAVLGAAQQPMLAAVAAAQNLALYNQNPAYAALFGQNPLLAAVALNPTAAAALNPAAAAVLNPAAGLIASQGQALGGGMGVGSGAPSLLGAYGSQGMTGLQGLQSYQGSQLGHSSSMKSGGSFGSFPSYGW